MVKILIDVRLKKSYNTSIYLRHKDRLRICPKIRKGVDFEGARRLRRRAPSKSTIIFG